jgi:glycosyltransferase involved in cell wall biosynthesis
MDKSVCIVVSTMMTVRAFLLDHIAALGRRYNIALVADTDDVEFFSRRGLHISIFPVPIKRKVMPWADLKAFFYLVRIFQKHRFDAIYSVTPKAGLLTMTAGFFARAPVRVHTFTGQVWATRKGLSRWVLKRADRLIALSATNILVDSFSQRDFLINENIVTKNKSTVLANGSICGVDKNRFQFDECARRAIRNKEGINEEDIVFLYVGRLNKEKGLFDLACAFSKLCIHNTNVHMMIIGPDEENMTIKMRDACDMYPRRLHFVGYTDAPEQYMSAADVFCLPSYREGFGMTIIEAAFAGIPSIGTKIYGVTDAIEENTTGYLHEPGDIEGLLEKMQKMIDEPEVRMEMGKNARERAMRLFSKEHVTNAFIDYFQSLPGMSGTKENSSEKII